MPRAIWEGFPTKSIKWKGPPPNRGSVGNGRKDRVAKKYDPNVDYQALINEAVSKGNTSDAAKYESLRNEKIADMGITDYKPTYNYTSSGGSSSGVIIGGGSGSSYDRYTGGGSSSSSSSGSSSGSLSSGGGDWNVDRDYTGSKTISQSDHDQWLNQLNTNKGLWASASEAERKRLHQENEELGKKLGMTYNSTTGEWTGGYGITPSTSGGGFSYGDAPSYEDPYDDRLSKLLDSILNYKDFAYDPANDPLYQQYAQQYQREGQRAMQDTLGNVAASTGGLASSYATTAASQARDYYATKQADKIPELQQLAYQKYLNDIDKQIQDLGLLTGASDRDYQRYRDTVTDWRDGRDFAYGQYRDDINDKRYDQEWNYNVGRDEIMDQRYNQEWSQQQAQWEYQKQQDELDRKYQENADAYERALMMWQMLGYVDEGSARVLGVPAGTKSSDELYRMAQLTASRSSGRGSSSNGSGEKEEKLEKPYFSQLISMMKDTDNPQSPDELAKKYAITNSDYAKLVEELDKMFDQEMEDIARGKTQYTRDLRNGEYGRELTAKWQKLYGQDGYKQLLQEAARKEGVSIRE